MIAAAVARYMARQLGSVKKCWCSPAVGLHATNSSTPPVDPQLFTSESSTCARKYGGNLLVAGASFDSLDITLEVWAL